MIDLCGVSILQLNSGMGRKFVRSPVCSHALQKICSLTMTCMTKNADGDISEKGKDPKRYFLGM